MRAMGMAVAVVLSAFKSVGVADEAPPMEEIEGGSYPIGSPDGRASARPRHRVTLDPFLIDAYEVTNAQFAAFLGPARRARRRTTARTY